MVPPGQGATGSAVRSALGLGTPPPVGRAARYLGGGETLTLHPLPTSQGDVTAELTPTAWLVSSLLAAGDAYADVVADSDGDLGKAATTAADGLPADLALGLTPGSAGSPSLRAVHDCLEPVTVDDALDPTGAEKLLRAAVHCAPHYFARPLGRVGASPASLRLGDHVGRVVLNQLLRALTAAGQTWNAFPGTTQGSAYRIWLGPPPPQELDYEAAPMTFAVGAAVDVPAWTPEFSDYVRERLDYLVTNSDTDAAGCADGSFTVRRYRSDGFALAGQVSCGGVPHQLVLKQLDDGWHEVDDTEATADDPDAHFSCSLMRLYSVPAFIAGSRCSDGAEVQDYP